jgi:hypothetical protein
MYTLFISQFENPETDEKKSDENLLTKRELVVIDPSGPRDSAGGYHPGFWSIEHYASLLGEEHRKLFLKVIDQIKDNIASECYRVNADGSISIHIRKQDRASAISVACRAEWSAGS